MNPMLNKVINRFLPITVSVAKGLEPEPKISDFDIIKQIGEGSFGRVYLAKHKSTQMIYAIKEINKLNKNNQEGKPYFRREIEIMYKIHHPNVVRLYSNFEDDKNCYFVMEYVKQGNLFDQESWQRYHSLTSMEVAKYMKDLISAVYYLHNMFPPIIHRDIKPENVLIDENGHAKLTDFGWSNYVNSEVRSTYCGTPVYLAPEMIKEIGHDATLDIWCIGILMFELLTGNVPFRGKDFQSLNDNILKLKIQWPKDINIDAKNLISKILKPDPKDRLSLVNMLKHQFFTKHLGHCDLLAQCLVKPLINETTKPFTISRDVIEDGIMNSNTSTITNTNISETSISISNINNTKIKDNKQHKGNKEKEKDKDKDKENGINISNANKFQKIQLSNDNNINNNNDDDNEEEEEEEDEEDDNENNNNNNQKEDKAQLAEEMQIEFEQLSSAYKSLLLSKNQLEKKLEESNQRELYINKERIQLLAEIEEKNKQNAFLMTTITSLKQSLLLKDQQIASLTNGNTTSTVSANTTNNNLSEEDYELLLKTKQQEYQSLINDKEGSDVLDNHLLNFHQSIKKINDALTMQFEYSNPDEFGVYKSKMEGQLKMTKDFLEKEIETICNETKKEKEQLLLQLKLKEEEINTIKMSIESNKSAESEKSDKVIEKYKSILKSKESEIEVLKLKNKKMEMMYNTYMKKAKESDKDK